MFHFFEAITNTSGDSLVGYFARVIDPTSQAIVPLASDNNGTPIITVSGIENMGRTDENGNLSIYVEPGTYHLDIYAPNATSFIMRVRDVSMNSGIGPEGPEGQPGPPGEITFAQLASLQGKEVNATFDSSNPLEWGFRIRSESTARQVDGILATADYLGSAAAGYPFHGVAYADEGVGGGRVGGGGFAIGGPGPGSGAVGNRRESGIGHGVIGTRDGTGAGAGVVGTAQGTGTNPQPGVRALKQNVTGAPGGDSSPGPALEVINSAEQGYAIESTTLANNASDVSNFYDRRNVTHGVVSRRAILRGGARTGPLTIDDILIQPETPLTGNFLLTGTSITIREEATGASEATGISISNAATNATSSFGVVAVTSGVTGGTNTGGKFSARNGASNISVDCGPGVALFRDGVQALGLPTYADNQAAVTGGLAQGRFYRTATGQVMVVFGA